jgi:hypothetical protein
MFSELQGPGGRSAAYITASGIRAHQMRLAAAADSYALSRTTLTQVGSGRDIY